MEIRSEGPADIAAIAEVVTRAFAGAVHASGDEAAIVERLRAAGALPLSLVAERPEGIAGHVAASPVTIDGRPGWFGIGPLAVAPALQKRGIGSALMEAALAWLEREGARGAVLVGDPGYYRRFGFRHEPSLIVEGIPPEYVLARPFRPPAPTGLVAFHRAFGLTPRSRGEPV